jgi:tetratricopeptide (TPR) repeat protein
LATKHFAKSLMAFDMGVKDKKLSREQTETLKPTVIDCYSNQAVCYSKLSCHEMVLAFADKVLAMSPGHFKALFRKGEAHLQLKNYEAARDCFKECLDRADPDIKGEVERALGRVRVA